jgi:hypothetical protein
MERSTTTSSTLRRFSRCLLAMSPSRWLLKGRTNTRPRQQP